jgi:hypothetical protein
MPPIPQQRTSSCVAARSYLASHLRASCPDKCSLEKSITCAYLEVLCRTFYGCLQPCVGPAVSADGYRTPNYRTTSSFVPGKHIQQVPRYRCRRSRVHKDLERMRSSAGCVGPVCAGGLQRRGRVSRFVPHGVLCVAVSCCMNASSCVGRLHTKPLQLMQCRLCSVFGASRAYAIASPCNSRGQLAVRNHLGRALLGATQQFPRLRGGFRSLWVSGSAACCRDLRSTLPTPTARPSGKSQNGPSLLRRKAYF